MSVDVRRFIAAVSIVGSIAAPALAQETEPTDAEIDAMLDQAALEVPAATLEDPSASFGTTARATRPRTAASSSTVRDRDFELRPRPRPADILQAVPGFYVVQHAGGGKANQYFLRGFDADHGTDVAMFVDGVPVNMVSHGHGQGYTDLHFLIPELVQRIEVAKGPYFARYGDFATAGAFDLQLRDDIEGTSLSFTGGSFDTFRGVAITGADLGGGARLTLAGELYGTDGPFANGEDTLRGNGFARVSHPFAGGTLQLTGTTYAGRWDASGQVPLRAVRSGQMSRFESIDPDEGGESERHSLTARWRSGDWSVLAYGVRYAFDLYSNFTFYSADPDAGDMIHQSDRRWTTGGEITWRHDHELFGNASTTTIGMRLRGDAIENGLATAPGRQDLVRSVDASVFEASAGVFAEHETEWTPWLRSVLGVRADTFGFDVEDRLGEGDGTAADALVSPKASAIFTPVEDLDLYVNFGTGFHSNDARGVVRGVTPLSRAVGGEVGARVRLLDRIDLAAAGFVLDLASETVWVGDAGTTEARGATRRYGVELEARAELLPWLHADVDFTATRAAYVESPSNADAVALAPTRMISGGLTARHPMGLFGRIGAVHIADRPATEDGSLIAEGFTRVDATAGWRNERVELSLSVQNLLDTEWREAQFANVSRLPHETTPAACPAGTRAVGEGAGFEGCEDVHFTPGAPLNVQANATLRF